MSSQPSRGTKRKACVHVADQFCYVCGKFLKYDPKKRKTILQRRDLTDNFKSAYHAYFGLEVGDQDRTWAPHFSCSTCFTNLSKWYKNGTDYLKLSVPVQWRVNNCPTDCYFCNGKEKGFCQSATAPIHRLPTEPPPVWPPVSSTSSMDKSTMKSICESAGIIDPAYDNLEDSDSDESEREDSGDEDYVEASGDGKPILFTQDILDAYVITLGLNKDESELLGSMLRSQNLLAPGTLTSVYRKRDQRFSRHFGETQFVQMVPKKLSTAEKEEKKMEEEEGKKLKKEQKKKEEEEKKKKKKAKGNGKRKNGKKVGKNGANEEIELKRKKKKIEMEEIDVKLVYCKDIPALMAEFKIDYKEEDWRLFMDSSEKSFKAVLLFNGDPDPERTSPTAVPIAYSSHMKEEYDAIKIVLTLLKYKLRGSETGEHEWPICADLKVVAVVCGLKKNYCSHQCFLCDWKGREQFLHFTNYPWKRATEENTHVGERSIYLEPLVKSEKILLPDLHIKLGLMQQFVKAMDKKSEAFRHLQKKLAKVLSPDKIRLGQLNGPQIRSLMKDEEFEQKLKDAPSPHRTIPKAMFKALGRRYSQVESQCDNPEYLAWLAFKAVVDNFLGKHRAENYKEYVSEMLGAFRDMGCNMSLKLHFLHYHLDFFPDNISAFSDQHGERVHQIMNPAEARYKGRAGPRFLGDQCWLLQSLPDVGFTIKKRRQN